MSYGAVQSAIAAMKNNRNLLSKRKRGKGLKDGYVVKKEEFNLPKATPKQLNDIKVRMKREHLKRRVLQITLLTALMILFLSVFFFYF